MHPNFIVIDPRKYPESHQKRAYLVEVYQMFLFGPPDAITLKRIVRALMVERSIGYRNGRDDHAKELRKLIGCREY